MQTHESTARSLESLIAQIRDTDDAIQVTVSDAQEDEILARDFVQNVVVQSLLGQGVLEPAYRSLPLPGRVDIDTQIDTETALSVSPVLIEMATIRIAHSKRAGAVSFPSCHDTPPKRIIALN